MAKPRSRNKEPVEALWPDDGVTMEIVGDRLGWAKVYWMVGPAPRDSRHRNDVNDPPNAGQSSVFVLPAGGRRVRLFCPYTLQGYDVGEDSMEFNSLAMPKRPLNKKWAAETLLRNWRANEGYGFQRDFDTAARVMVALKLEVPMRVARPVDPAAPPSKKPNGKPAGEKLLKPVSRDSRRGQVLTWFMDELGPRSVREAMAEFDTTRSNVLTVLFNLHKDHGVGYTLNGDAAEVVLPKSCKNLFC